MTRGRARTAHNVHPLGSFDEEDTFRSLDDADSGLPSSPSFNYLAPSPSFARDGVRAAVFSAAPTTGTDRKVRCSGALMYYLREHASWGRNRKYRSTIAAISRKNRPVLRGDILLGPFFRTPTTLRMRRSLPSGPRRGSWSKHLVR